MAEATFPIHLRAKQTFTGGILVVGAALALLSLAVGSVVTVITGLLIALYGLSFLNRPMATVDANQVSVYNALGMAMKKLPFSSTSSLDASGKKFMVISGGKPKSTGVSRWLIREEDWAKLEAATSS